jgi:hypothetical protein
VIVFVEKRLPIDEEKYKTERARWVNIMSEFQKNMLFSEWLKLRRAAAGLQTNFRG